MRRRGISQSLPAVLLLSAVCLIMSGKEIYAAKGAVEEQASVQEKADGDQAKKDTGKAAEDKAEKELDSIALDQGAWSLAHNWNKTSTSSKSGSSLVIQNDEANHAMLAQKVKVKPYTAYRIRAKVRVEDYGKGNENPGGATVWWDGGGIDMKGRTEFVTSKGWTDSQIVFNSGKKEEVTLYLSNGGYSALSKGKAYFRDVYLDELPTDNKWNVLALVIKTVQKPDLTDKTQSFTDEEVKRIQETLGKLPSAMEGLSKGRMEIGEMDIETVDTPVNASISQSNGYSFFTYGPGQDIDLDEYLEDHDYNQVIVIAPLAKLDGNGWGAWGGGSYLFQGRKVYYSIAGGSADEKKTSATIDGVKYDTNVSGLIHGFLRCMDVNSRENGIETADTVGAGEANGYNLEDAIWLDYYADAMRGKLKNGKPGYEPESFLVSHIPQN